ncbi:hypothetical protein SODALDRAFT_357608 [Sodiomyces alkalinus F11]|uniref:Uncharacterized protein n=1 Tax=Sodiomyces alkalinus (strain CBS 110278 / VKM F-3762 / F11) TaxID=1314773 RepID=A0A3N2Q453_SODAK|nr:hypothetical protein SODALDRAFT_357608 [Sodiomyces alkalinus F11]ROT41554.1 hypothetical protein SODALDRAFT_357608 [Sodiomyces alkalinus F11]
MGGKQSQTGLQRRGPVDFVGRVRSRPTTTKRLTEVSGWAATVITWTVVTWTVGGAEMTMGNSEWSSPAPDSVSVFGIYLPDHREGAYVVGVVGLPMDGIIGGGESVSVQRRLRQTDEPIRSEWRSLRMYSVLYLIESLRLNGERRDDERS